MHRSLLLTLFAAAGCGDPCEGASRLDGGWAVYADPTTASIGGDNAGNYPWDAVFVSGWSEWDLSWVAGRKEFRLQVDGQPFTAAWAQDEVDCDAFTLDFDGTWISSAGTTHRFGWAGDLEVAGSHLQGTFAFTDDWEDPVEATGGTLELQGGSFTANQR